jgi:hypothetical protein
MSLESPIKTLFNSDGYEIVVKEGESLPANSGAFLLAGSDGTDTHYISLDSEGRKLVAGAGTPGSPAEGVVSAQGTAGTIDELKVMGHVNVDNFLSDISIVQDDASQLLANVGGLGVVGSTVVGNPVRVGASDGVNTKDLLSDSSGKLIVAGAADSGSALAGAPVRIAATDGTDALDILADSSGRLISVGAAADGSAVAGAPILLGGSDGTDTRTLETDSLGRLIYVGAVADGVALAGNPVRLGASDGSITRDILSDDQGRLIMVGAAAAGSAPLGFPLLTGGWDGANVQIFKLDSNGALQVNPTKANSAVITTAAASLINAELLAANAEREGAIVYNNSNRPMFIKLGSAATTSSFTIKLGAFDYYEVPAGYTGSIHALWTDAAAAGDARITELVNSGSGFVTITINGVIYQISSETNYNLVEPPTEIVLNGTGSYSIYEEPSTLITSGTLTVGSLTVVPDIVSTPGSYYVNVNDGENPAINIYFDI